MKTDTIFVIPFILPWDWSADYQRQTCFELAKHHDVVAYMQRDSIFVLKALFCKRRYPNYDRIQFYRPLYFFPFRRFHKIEALNQQLSYRLFEWNIGSGKNIVLWIFDSTFDYLAKLARGISLYDCVDYVWDRDPKRRAAIRIQEQRLIRRVKFFFVNSHTLARVHQKIRQPTAIVPQGFRIDDFCNALQAKTRFPKPKPIIGYVGALDYRIDTQLLSDLIQRNPQWQFVLWGPIQAFEQYDVAGVVRFLKRIRAYPNVVIGKSKDSGEIPTIIQQFSIGIVPYSLNTVANRYGYPMKLFEYFYMGKPVVSTPIEELKRFSKYVKIGKTVKSWEQNIAALLSYSWPTSYKKEQRRLARQNSWKNKIRIITNILA